MVNSQLLSTSREEGNRVDENYLDEVAVDLDKIVGKEWVIYFIMLEDAMRFRSSDVLESGIPPKDPREPACSGFFSL